MNEALTLARMLARVVAPESNSPLPPNHPFNTTANPFGAATVRPPVATQPAARAAATSGSPQHAAGTAGTAAAAAAAAATALPLLFDDMPLD